MKRWTLISTGSAMAVIAILTLLYQLMILWEMPILSASALVGSDSESPAQRANLTLVCRRQNFILSTDVLYPVCDALDLTNQWGIRYNGGAPLTKREACEFLARRLSVSYPTDGKGLVKIYFYTERPGEAGTFADAVARSVTNQLIRSKSATNSNLNLWIENSTEEQRHHNWFHFGRSVIFIAIPCGIVGVILLWWGYRSPPPVLSPPPPPQSFQSKY